MLVTFPKIILTETYRYFCGPKYHAIYTKPNSGQAKYSALTQEGNAKYDEMLGWARTGRSTNRRKCRVVEKQVLANLRERYEIIGDDYSQHKKRRRQEPTVQGLAACDDDDFEEDQYVEDSNEELDLDNIE